MISKSAGVVELSNLNRHLKRYLGGGVEGRRGKETGRVRVRVGRDTLVICAEESDDTTVVYCCR